MFEYKNIRLIGSSHISEQSIKEVKNSFQNYCPDILAVELDQGRLHALMHKERSSKLAILRSVGITGFIFAVIGEAVQKLLGRIVRIDPGEEMLQAIKLAQKNKMQIFLIDQNIEITLKKFSKRLTWKEKFNFFIDLITGVIPRKEKFEFDLKKVPSEKLIIKLIGKIKEKYPNMYDVLIHERNVIMANKLLHLSDRFPEKKILGVVGAGHLPGIKEIIRNVPTITYSFDFNEKV